MRELVGSRERPGNEAARVMLSVMLWVIGAMALGAGAA
jgi:hypothetical protein